MKFKTKVNFANVVSESCNENDKQDRRYCFSAMSQEENSPATLTEIKWYLNSGSIGK